MSNNNTCFSDGNMAANRVSLGPNLEDFQRIPFEKVFHHGRYNPFVESDIKYHRQAEVLIPNELILKENLECIACRSLPEYHTFIHFLNPQKKIQWRNSFRLGDSSLFERRWAFVTNVEFSQKELIFHFNSNSEHQADFNATVKLESTSSIPQIFEKSISAKDYFNISLENFNADEITIELDLDGALAYKNKLWLAEMPLLK